MSEREHYVPFAGFYYRFDQTDDGVHFLHYAYAGRSQDLRSNVESPGAGDPPIRVYPEGTGLRSEGWVVTVGPKEIPEFVNMNAALLAAAKRAADYY